MNKTQKTQIQRRPSNRQAPKQFSKMPQGKNSNPHNSNNQGKYGASRRQPPVETTKRRYTYREAPKPLSPPNKQNLPEYNAWFPSLPNPAQVSKLPGNESAAAATPLQSGGIPNPTWGQNPHQI